MKNYFICVYAENHAGTRFYETWLHEADDGALVDINFDPVDDIMQIVNDIARLVSPFPSVYSGIVVTTNSAVSHNFTINGDQI